MNIFETFECLVQILSNSLCHFWNDKLFPLQILYPFTVSWKIIPLYVFSSNNIYFTQKELIKMNFLRLLSARVKFFQAPYANFETTSRFLSKFCIPLQFHERLCLCTFLAQTIYTLLKRSSLKWQFLRLLSARVKFCQIPFASYETSWFFSKFCIPLQFFERLILYTFLAQTICTLLKRSSLK